jgi:hypothetical protein
MVVVILVFIFLLHGKTSVQGPALSAERIFDISIRSARDFRVAKTPAATAREHCELLTE